MFYKVCETCAQLSQAIAKAIQKSYQAKDNLEVAQHCDDILKMALESARLVERKTVRALDEHKRQHAA